MNNRYFKIFISVLMICCLLFSFTFQAHATFPGQVGEFGGAIATIIAQSMGIDLDLREMSIDSINNFLGILSDINQKIWVISTGAGMTALGLAKEGYDELAQYIKDLVIDKNIQDNTTATIYEKTGQSYEGWYAGDIVGSKIWTSPSITFLNGPWSATVRTQGFSAYIDYYLHDELYLTQRVDYNIVTGSGTITDKIYEFNGKLGQQFITQSGRIISGDNGIVTGDIKTESVSYTSGIVDTTVGDNLPSTGGMIINFPNTVTGSIDEILANLSEQVLSNETENITTEFVNDIGEPVVTDQTIADTPWNDLAGTLDQIKAYLQNLHINVQGHISSALDSIVDGVDAITEDVALGTSTTVKAYIDNFIELYLPWIQEIGSYGSIWNYVVSWIGSISSCFSWSLSALSSCGATFLAPIYAAFAGAVVIAIYRRFGR